MLTRELTGVALDWAVAKCEEILDQIELEIVNGEFALHVPNLCCSYEPSICWTQAGPIIECKQIGLDYAGAHKWIAWFGLDIESVLGPTPLIAAMRCYVASKLGDEIEIPKELM